MAGTTTALIIALAGVGFLAAAFYLWLIRTFAADVAAAIVGGVLIALAIIVVAACRLVFRKQRGLTYPAKISDEEIRLALLVALDVIPDLVRRDPARAVGIALLAGAASEFLSGKPKRDKSV